jgi:hypothetical protein
MRLAILLCCAILAWAEESAAVAAFHKAMAGDDFTVKRAAIEALVSKDAGDDDTILPLLIAIVDDRQGSEPAIKALRARTGLAPAEGGSYRQSSAYPGYPASDSRASWDAWLAARTKDIETKKTLAEIEKKIDKVAEQTKPGEAKPEEATAEVIAPPPRIPTDDLGKPDRLVYKSGRTLIAFVRSKRLDGDGNLVSVRVVHLDGAGEEVIDAAGISRIEEDVE